MSTLPDTQLVLRPGIIEMNWGNPDPELLPVRDLALAAEWALQRDGSRALTYGAEQGPGRLLSPLAAWLSQREGRTTAPEQLFITGGVSQGLDLLCTLLTRAGDPVLVQSPVYHLALRIFRDHRLELVPVGSDEAGLRIDALQSALADLSKSGRRPCFLYTVPTFCNPTGVNLAPDRRVQLVRLAESAGLSILEDDVYRELWYDAPSPPSLQSLAIPGTVVRLGSFSKILAPGLRLGWLDATPELVQRCAGSGLLDSGGGINHFTAHVVAAYLEANLLDGRIERLRRVYAARRDALADALAHYLPPDCSWARPGGGFFVWLRLPEGCDSAALLSTAEKAGVSFVPGARFCAGRGGERHLRLAFSLLAANELAEGAVRLGALLNQ